jgi:hypothetical protein
MKQLEHILAEVQVGKTCTRRQLYRYLKRFKIAPIPPRKRPQLYPEDAAETILTKLGLKVVSMRKLRAVKRQAQKAKAA